jgi:Ca2+-binding RTX toxin-like protein
MANITGTAVDDFLNGTPLADIIDALTGDDRMEGAEGSDHYRVGVGFGFDTILDSGGADDRLLVTSLQDIVSAKQDGGDLVIAFRGGSSVKLENHLVSADRVEAVHDANGSLALGGITPGSGAAEILAGTDGNDILRGGGGGDFIFGAAGDDFVFGGDGDDRLGGGDGNDFLIGGGGDDHMTGGPGTDIHVGGGGAGFHLTNYLLWFDADWSNPEGREVAAAFFFGDRPALADFDLV